MFELPRKIYNRLLQVFQTHQDTVLFGIIYQDNGKFGLVFQQGDISQINALEVLAQQIPSTAICYAVFTNTTKDEDFYKPLDQSLQIVDPCLLHISFDTSGCLLIRGHRITLEGLESLDIGLAT